MGIIDRINELIGQVAYGMENTVDESMSAIRFRTTP